MSMPTSIPDWIQETGLKKENHDDCPPCPDAETASSSTADEFIINTPTATTEFSFTEEEFIIKTPTATTTEFNFPTSSAHRTDTTETMGSWHEKHDQDYTPTVPQPGKTYRIHLRGTNELITLEDGHLQLLPDDGGKSGGGYNWTCVEKSGWFGFRNRVSGAYMGRALDRTANLGAVEHHHRFWEFFTVRPDPRGGCALLITHSAEELWRVSIGTDGKTLVRMEHGDAQWEFEEV